MKKRQIMCLALLSFAASAFAQSDLDKTEIKITRVAGTVYMLEGAGGNIGLSVGPDGVLMVDDQYAPLSPKLKAAIKTITPKPVIYLLNTHWHGDHTGGNETFGETAPIIAHKNVRARLMGGAERGTGKIDPAPVAALPDITYDDHVVIHVNGEDIGLLHFTRGHTDGDSIVYFPKANVLHMGDVFFEGMFPFIDLDSGGSVTGLIDTIQIVLRDYPADAKLIPGHGPLSTMDGLRKHLRMLQETSAIVRKGIAEGKTAQQLKDAKVLAAYDSLSWSFVPTDTFVDTLYRDLK